MSYRPKRVTIISIASVFLLSSTPLVPANAAFVPTNRTIHQETQLSERARVDAYLDREDVRRELQKYGVTADEAKARVAALSDSEIRQITQKMDENPAGGDSLGVILGVALTVFVILLITDLLCLTHVFNFTRCAAR